MQFEEMKPVLSIWELSQLKNTQNTQSSDKNTILENTQSSS